MSFSYFLVHPILPHSPLMSFILFIFSHLISPASFLMILFSSYSPHSILPLLLLSSLHSSSPPTLLTRFFLSSYSAHSILSLLRHHLAYQEKRHSLITATKMWRTSSSLRKKLIQVSRCMDISEWCSVVYVYRCTVLCGLCISASYVVLYTYERVV